MSKISDLYQSVTDSIVAELDAGTAPWVKPWRAGKTNGLMPANAATGRSYSGINIPILWQAARASEYPTHRWMTLRQANGLRAHVRKGQRGTEIVLVHRVPIEADEEREKQATRQVLRTYIVFNVGQIEGLPEPAPAEPPATNEQLEIMIAATDAKICSGGDSAFYAPAEDSITMPGMAAFDDSAGYYATLLHELGHWSGHPTRLNRDLSHRFGAKAYAAEELIAELTAAFLCADLGIRGELQHAGYIRSWISLLNEDNRAIFTSASKASEAAGYLNAFRNGSHQ